MFICRHCPFVKHVEKETCRYRQGFRRKGIGIAAISSNDADCYSEDSPPSLRQQAELLGFTFPYLYDETQEVARAYDATCTPDFFLFDKDLKLVYRGQLDDSRPGNGIATDGRDLREAMNALIAGKPISESRSQALGAISSGSSPKPKPPIPPLLKPGGFCEHYGTAEVVLLQRPDGIGGN